MKNLAFFVFFLLQFPLFAQPFKSASLGIEISDCNFLLTIKAETEEIALAALQRASLNLEMIHIKSRSNKFDEINNMAGEFAVETSPNIYDFIVRAKLYAERTNGFFDISAASNDLVYEFDQKKHGLPSEEELSRAISKVNWQNIELDENRFSVFLKEKGMKVNFNGIRMGYMANMLQKIMSELPEVKGASIRFCGNLVVWGEMEEPYTLINPSNKKPISLILKDNSAITLGDPAQYFTHRGERYTPFINPKTGLPSTGIKRVTIVSKDSELAYALATAVFSMGTIDGLKLINGIADTECIIVTDEGRLVKSDHIQFGN